MNFRSAHALGALQGLHEDRLRSRAASRGALRGAPNFGFFFLIPLIGAAVSAVGSIGGAAIGAGAQTEAARLATQAAQLQAAQAAHFQTLNAEALAAQEAEKTRRITMIVAGGAAALIGVVIVAKLLSPRPRAERAPTPPAGGGQ